MKKKAQMEISFGMIFSIILIIVFIASAVYGVTKFLNLQKNVQTEKFKSDFQDDVNKIWASSLGSQVYFYSLPDKIKKVCFEEDEYEGNLRIFTGETQSTSERIEHLEISSPFCVNNEDGKIQITLKKDFGETLVQVSE